MKKAERLLEIIRILHKRKYAVTARELSSEFGISLRSVYRDISSLQLQGIPIDGETGVGYMLRKGYTLPPLMFTIDEIEAIVAGVKWVLSTGDTTLATSAKEAIQKIKDTIPPALQNTINEAPLLIGYKRQQKIGKGLTQAIHDSIRKNEKLIITYSDELNKESERIIWPIALGYFDSTVVLAAWCELRKAFRHFRVDRVKKWSRTHEKYPLMHALLYKKWQKEKNIESSSIDI